MLDEKGAVYPLVITLSLLALIFFGYFTEKVFSERQFVYGQEELLREVRLVQQAMDKASLLVHENTTFPREHHFIWNEGTVDITIYETAENERLIMIDAVTKQQHTKKVNVYYNVSQNSVTKWVEG